MRPLPFTKEQMERITKEYPTPFHIYDEKGIRENVRRLQRAFAWNRGFREYFAVKALPNPVIMKILHEEGCGMDCSSLTELMLSGAVLAQVFNMLGASTGNIVGFIVISLVGNTLNLALNLLGCYVHDMRLQFLEFFGRFYKEGGKAYRPLRLQAKHVEIIKEENES